MYYAFAVFMGLTLVELAIIIKQKIELRDLRMVAKAFIKKLEQEDATGEN